MATILIVEDEPDLARGLRFNLEHDGHAVTIATCARDATRRLAPREPSERPPFDLVILDLNLPDGDGLDVLRALRAGASKLPVLCLTARTRETDVVMGLTSGADDYLRKPFSLAEFLARVAALLRRAALEPTTHLDESIPLGAARYDRRGKRIVHRDRIEELTPIESGLLDYLLRRRGEALERRAILEDLWGVDAYTPTRTLDNHVARLRRKIERDPQQPRLLVTVHGIGYRLENDATSS
jgi:DNA-binding response OmpR family regulator